MAALGEGKHYRLSAPPPEGAKKTVIYVKLTDSALGALEESFNRKVSYVLVFI